MGAGSYPLGGRFARVRGIRGGGVPEIPPQHPAGFPLRATCAGSSSVRRAASVRALELSASFLSGRSPATRGGRSGHGRLASRLGLVERGGVNVDPVSFLLRGP